MKDRALNWLILNEQVKIFFYLKMKLWKTKLLLGFTTVNGRDVLHFRNIDVLDWAICR